MKETFSNSIFLELKEREGNSDAVLISAVFITRYHVHFANAVLTQDLLDV